VHGTNEPPPNCPHKRTLETGKASVAESYEPHLGMYLLQSTSPVFDEKGKIISSVHIARDISVQKQQEEQLIMTDRLASIGELVSGIAHELNNPLTSVIGFSQLLKEADVPPEAKDDLDIISKEAERAAGIVKNLLTFARKHEPVKQRSHINNIIEDVIKLRAYEQKVNNITLRKRLARNLPEIMADYFQMQQVFLNIIVNAEAAMVEAHKKGTLTISTRKIDSSIRISFTDDGPGITKENLNRIFNPFFTTKEVGKGTGLGLSICHGIVTAHSGKIYARSKPGNGTTFVVELPVNSS
jgi:signal transduction histidine kinase